MIGISGIARSGKDTMSNCLKEIIEEEWDCKVEIVHLAKKLKSDLDKVVSCNFNFLVDTDNDSDKELIRPLLVAYGEAMKKKWGKDIWIKKLFQEIKARKDKKLYIVSDVRFDFEAEKIKKENGYCIHLVKNGHEVPANETERINDPLVAEKCDYNYTWPRYHPDNMQMCKDHAHIVWQMIPETVKEKWKKTLI